MSGTRDRVVDEPTRTVDGSLTGTKRMDACTYQRNDRRYTVDGSLDMTATRRRVDGQPDGEHEHTLRGRVTVRRDEGDSRSCDIDITAVRDWTAREIRVTGSICGQSVDRRRSMDESL